MRRCPAIAFHRNRLDSAALMSVAPGRSREQGRNRFRTPGGARSPGAAMIRDQDERCRRRARRHLRDIVNCAGHGAWCRARHLGLSGRDSIRRVFWEGQPLLSFRPRSLLAPHLSPSRRRAASACMSCSILAGRTALDLYVRWVDTLHQYVYQGEEETFRDAVGLPAGRGGTRHRRLGSRIRPKMIGPGAANAHFRIDGPETHGTANLVNCSAWIAGPDRVAGAGAADFAKALQASRNDFAAATIAS